MIMKTRLSAVLMSTLYWWHLFIVQLYPQRY